MYDIEMQEMTPDFLKCWQAAGVHIDKQVQGGMRSWLRCHPYGVHVRYEGLERGE